MKQAILALLAILLCCPLVQAQNIEHQIVASQFGAFQVPTVGNGFSFPPDSCQVSGGNKNFPAFVVGVPIKIVDSQPTHTEIQTPVAVNLNNNNCSVSMATTYSHTSFYLTSGTGGLQEALNSGQVTGGANTVILDQQWYAFVSPGTPSAVIASAHGNSMLGVVDVTTSPYTSYTWNGSQYVQNPSSGGANTPATSLVLKGGGPANTVAAATPGVDYALPNSNTTGSAGSLSAISALPNGTTASTGTVGENDTKVATNAQVAATAQASIPAVTNVLKGAGVAGTSIGAVPNVDYVTPAGSITGSAGSLSAASALPNATTAVTQTVGDNSTDVATDAFVRANGGSSTPGGSTTQVQFNNSSAFAGDATFTFNNATKALGVQSLTTTVSATTPLLNAPRVGTVYFADGFVGALYPGIGAATVAYSSASNVAACQSVSYSGNYYIALTGINASTTPGTNLAVWWPVPQTGATTTLDCAWYTAQAAKHANHVSEMVVAGGSAYQTNGLVDYVDGSSYDDEYSVGLAGSGVSATYLLYSGASAIPVINRPTGGGNFAPMLFHDMTIDGNAVASADMELGTMNASSVYNISAGHVAAGTDHVIEFGHFGGDAFQVAAHDINIGIYPDSNTANCGVFAANVVSGSVTSYTVNTPGTCYSAASSRNVYHVQLRGYGSANTATLPCTVMPTGQVVTLSGSGVASISEGTNTGGSGCSGTIYVQVYSTTPVNYGVIFYNSDSHAEHITSYLGDLAAFYIDGGNDSFTHLHPSVVIEGINTNATASITDTEIDAVFDKAFIFNEGFAGVTTSVKGTSGYNGSSSTSRLLVGSSMYYLANSTSVVNFASSGALCNTLTGLTGWQEFVTQSGPIVYNADYIGKAPNGMSVTGNDTQCGEVMGDYINNLTAGTVNAYNLTATNNLNFGVSGAGINGTLWDGSVAGHSTYFGMNAGSFAVNNPYGNYVFTAPASGNSVNVQEGASPFAATQLWYRGTSTDSTGFWTQSPLGMNFELGDSAGTYALKVLNNGGTPAATIKSNGTLLLPSAGALSWNGDTGLVRNGAATINCGNGTAANVSCDFEAYTLGAGNYLHAYYSNFGSSNQGTIDAAGDLITSGYIAPSAYEQNAANATAGKCTMTTTTCTVTLAHTYTTPICTVSLQGTGTVIAGECSVSGTTATITAASSNTGTWAVMVFGDPN